MVAEDQIRLHDLFFMEGKQDIASLGEDQFFYNRTGSPILKEAIGYFECELVSLIDNGDFALAIGDIVSAEILHTQKQNLTVNQVLDRDPEFVEKKKDGLHIPFQGFPL